jgi:hypothetical protein
MGVDRIEGLFHDLAGIALFVFALVLFFVVDAVIISVRLLIRKASAFSRELVKS